MEAYESLGIIGEGTYGVVIRARHKATGQIVAIKKFKESEEDEQTRKTSLREVRVLKQLRHNNVINLLDVFRRKGKLHLVFEYVDSTILEVLEQTQNGIDSLSVKKYMYQLLKGLEFCHAQNIIHRDIKPENILISKHGTLKLCDFGFARPITLNGPVKYTDYVATRWYRAPELLVGDVEYGRGVDIWAVGCILAEVSNRLPLFPGESDLDQLAHILRANGSLPQRFVNIFYRNPLYRKVELPPQVQCEPIESRFPNYSASFITFLKGCLRSEPADRETCTSLLSSAYFTESGSSFSKENYEKELAILYEKEDLLRRQLQEAGGITPPQQPPKQQLPTTSTTPVITSTTPHPVGTLHEQVPEQSGSFPPQPVQGTLWSQYLASTAHELPELGAKSNQNSNNEIPSAVRSSVQGVNGAPTTTSNTSFLYGKGGFIMSNLPSIGSSGLSTTLGSSLGGSTSYKPPLQPQYVGHITNDSLGGSDNYNPIVLSTKSKNKSHPEGALPTLSATCGKKNIQQRTSSGQVSFLVTNNSTSPPLNTSSNNISSHLSYKKKSQKSNVLSSLNLSSFNNMSTIGGNNVVQPTNASGVDPFIGHRSSFSMGVTGTNNLQSLYKGNNSNVTGENRNSAGYHQTHHLPPKP